MSLYIKVNSIKLLLPEVYVTAITYQFCGILYSSFSQHVFSVIGHRVLTYTQLAGYLFSAGSSGYQHKNLLFPKGEFYFRGGGMNCIFTGFEHIL